jgi:hypothetical protein
MEVLLFTCNVTDGMVLRRVIIRQERYSMAVNPILFLLSVVYLTLALTSSYMRTNAVATVVALSLL